jgi:hypothetical protein
VRDAGQNTAFWKLHRDVSFGGQCTAASPMSIDFGRLSRTRYPHFLNDPARAGVRQQNNHVRTEGDE